MAEIPKQNHDGPAAQSAPPTANSRPKRQQKNNKNPIANIRQADGTVSDSATTSTASPRSKKQSKPRQQGTTNGAPPFPGNQALPNAGAPKQRPLSMGGNGYPATPPKEQAYAGPTFQASPAPSSLPVPRFFSRSVPKAGGLQAWMEEEKGNNAAQSSPEPDVVAPVPPRPSTQSPLDVFFNADKQEKSWNNSVNLTSPQLAARRPPMTEPRNPFQNPGRSVFLNEVDGDNSIPHSPQTLPVNRTRPSLAGERSYSSPGTPQSPAEEQREAYTKSLKDLLFNNVEANPQAQTPPRMRPSSQQSLGHTPTPQRSASRPETPAGSSGSADQHSLHYGNRNLSPFFQAARGHTPLRPASGLRQEVPHDGPYYSDSGAMNIPRQNRGPPMHDSNGYAHGFHNQMPIPPPQFHQQQQPFAGFPPVNQGMAPQAPPPNAYGQAQQHHQPQQGMPPAMQQNGYGQGYNASHTPPMPVPNGPTPPSSSSADIRTMEDDLRRMLKLNVLG